MGVIVGSGVIVGWMVGVGTSDGDVGIGVAPNRGCATNSVSKHFRAPSVWKLYGYRLPTGTVVADS